MWLAWRYGACLVPAPRALVRSGVDLGPWLVANEVTIVSTVPTLVALWPTEALARAQPGFVSFKSYVGDDGEVVALSEWADAAAARAWGSHAGHSEVQARGRAEYYQDYTLYTCENPRTHRFGAEG